MEEICSEIDRVNYRTACRKTNSLINASRNQHHCERIISAGKNLRQVWTAVKDLLHVDRGSQPVRLSADGDDSSFSSKLAVYFVNKVNNIRANIAYTLIGQDLDPLLFDQRHEGPCLSQFSPVTDDEVQRLLSSMSSKSSPLDFIPTSLLKASGRLFAHIIARLANLTFESGSFPTCFKAAQILSARLAQLINAPTQAHVHSCL